MTIQYQNGLRVQGMLLAAAPDCMRLALDSEGDAVELHKVNACWYTERGALVEIEAILRIPGPDFSRFCTEARPWTKASGRASLVA